MQIKFFGCTKTQLMSCRLCFKSGNLAAGLQHSGTGALPSIAHTISLNHGFGYGWQNISTMKSLAVCCEKRILMDKKARPSPSGYRRASVAGARAHIFTSLRELNKHCTWMNWIQHKNQYSSNAETGGYFSFSALSGATCATAFRPSL